MILVEAGVIPKIFYVFLPLNGIKDPSRLIEYIKYWGVEISRNLYITREEN